MQQVISPLCWCLIPFYSCEWNLIISSSVLVLCLCQLCEKRIWNKNNSSFCKGCTESHHKKCLVKLNLVKVFNYWNSGEITKSNEGKIFEINSQYITIFIGLNDSSLSSFYSDITSFNNYLDDLNNFPSIRKLQICIIGICENKIKKGSYQNDSLPGYAFEFEPTISSHESFPFFIN